MNKLEFAEPQGRGAPVAILAPPLGELSPQVTERALQPFLNGTIDLCAHTMKTAVNIPIGEPQNLQSKSS